MRKKSLLIATAFACAATPAFAALPEPVRAMIDAAIASGEADDIEAVTKIAKTTNPDDADEIDAMVAEYRAEQAQQAELEAREQEAELRQAGFIDNWSGEGEIGAFRSTGNSSSTGISGGVKLTKEGIDWTYKFRANADYQRSNGITTREQFRVALEPNYNINERLFAYGLAQYERDRFQGFSARYTLSGGIGYKIIDSENVQLSAKAGPAWRRTNFTGGGSDTSLAGLAAIDFGWQISDTLKFTEVADAYLESDNSTFTSITAIDAKLVGSLSARFSYTVEHETNPPIGRVSTDTLSRATLVYGF